MTVRKVAQRIPFKPTKTQIALFEQCFGARRFVYNQQVAAFNSYDKTTNPTPAYPNVSELKQQYAWMRDCPIPSNALSNTILDFRKALSAYFRIGNQTGAWEENRPTFKRKYDPTQSFRNSMPIRAMLTHNRYMLSKKLGSVKIPKRKPLRFPVQQLANWTVKRENNKYYLVLIFNTTNPKSKADTQSSIGIDMGIKTFATISNGTRITYPQQLVELEKTICKQQRKLSKRQRNHGKGQQSANYYKQKTRLTQAYAKLRHAKLNWQHHMANKLIEENQFIGMETLNVAGMVRRNHPQLDKHGNPTRNGQQRKSAMSRKIQRYAWTQFKQLIAYKAQWYGRTLTQVSQWYPSSKTCHTCQHVYRELRLSEREWTCSNCGSILDRDLNAALNIRDEALRLRELQAE